MFGRYGRLLKPARLAALLVLVLLCLTPGCSRLRPGTVVEQFYTLWGEQDYAAMYGLLDSASRKEYSEERFAERYAGISRGIGLEDIELTGLEKEESGTRQISFSLSVILKTSTVGKIPVQYEIQLGREKWGAPWRLQWHPGLIFPELTGESRVLLEPALPQRGAIYDRQGKMLAGPGLRKEVRALPGVYEEEALFVSAVAPLLGLSEEAITDKLHQPWVREGLYVPLAILDPKEKKVIKKLEQVKGLSLEEVQQRTYPAGASAAHLTGYLGEITAEELAEKAGYSEGDLLGKYGLESALENKLAGSKGYTLRIVGEDGAGIALIAEKEPQNGEDVELTVDLELQKCAAKALGNKRGAVVAIDPRTGEILVLYSNPGFDPNGFIAGLTAAAWQKLQEDEAQPFLNRAISGVYPPGSAFKPFTAAAALDAQVLSPEEKIKIKGERWQPSQSWGEYYVRRVHPEVEKLDLEEAMKFSDNIYFARAGLALGEKQFARYGERFGFGEQIPLPLPAARSRLSKEGLKSEIQLADSSFGQGEVLITPLQMALLYCPFAGEGSIPRPQLLPAEPQSWKEEAVSPAVAKTVHRVLVGAVHGTGAPSAAGAVPGFKVAGKTGTAEIDTGGGNICWYVTYGPARSPELVVAVVIEGAGWAAADALPVGRTVLERYLLSPRD